MPPTVAEKPEKAVLVEPFGIAADHPRNCDLLIQSIPGCRLRTRIIATRGVIDQKTGEVRIPIDQSIGLSTFPEVPGMEIHVNPANLTYVIKDPLSTNPDLCARIQRSLAQSQGIRIKGELRGVDTQKGTLDVHSMKTLCRELCNIVQAGEAIIQKGVLPDAEALQQMPGEFLLNPGSRVQTTQPRFEADFPEWIAQLTRSGG